MCVQRRKAAEAWSQGAAEVVRPRVTRQSGQQSDLTWVGCVDPGVRDQPRSKLKSDHPSSSRPEQPKDWVRAWVSCVTAIEIVLQLS